MKSSAKNDAIPEAAHEVIALYKDRARELAFPDVNAETLEQLQTALHTAQQEVDEAQAALEQACQTRQEREEELLLVAKRAFAYARVYAETDPELAAALQEMEFARPERSERRSDRRERKEKTPSRRRKNAPNGDDPRSTQPSAELPFDQELIAQA